MIQVLLSPIRMVVRWGARLLVDMCRALVRAFYTEIRKFFREAPNALRRGGGSGGGGPIIDVQVHGIPEMVTALGNMQKQVSYAAACAVNELALDAQRWVTADLAPHVLHLRSRGRGWWEPGMAHGFNIQFANKNKPEAVLGSRADWLQLVERGGEKRARKAGGKVAIPTEFWKPVDEMMTRERKPRAILAGVIRKARIAHKRSGDRLAREKAKLDLALTGARAGRKEAEGRYQAAGAAHTRSSNRLAKVRKMTSQLGGAAENQPFEATMGSGQSGIFIREGPGRMPIRMLFAYEEEAQVPELLDFERKAKDYIEPRIQAVFRRHLAKVLTDNASKYRPRFH